MRSAAGATSQAAAQVSEGALREKHSSTKRCSNGGSGGHEQCNEGFGSQPGLSGLLRDYVEKKVPLGDMRLLTLFGHYLAHAWEVAYADSNELMLGYVSRGLVMIEECGVDSGKTQMGWLLVGLPELNWSIISQNRCRTGIQPFAKLAQPSWVAANIGFLKDLDFMENRLKSAATKSNPKESEDAEKSDRPRKPWPKKSRSPMPRRSPAIQTIEPTAKEIYERHTEG